jgi:cell division septation protein DedD
MKTRKASLNMLNNQCGGIISKIFFIPAGLMLLVGFFFLGYYVGKYQNKAADQIGTLPPLPDLIANSVPVREEFTFYKTLTDRSDKTVSIDLRPKTRDVGKPEKAGPLAEKPRTVTVQTEPKVKASESTRDKEPTAPEKSPASAEKPSSPQRNRETASSSTRLRYTVQIAAYQEKGMADDEVKNLKKRGYAAFIASSELPGKGTWYRVRLGSFSSKTAAEKLQKTLHSKEGISPIVTIE